MKKKAEADQAVESIESADDRPRPRPRPLTDCLNCRAFNRSQCRCERGKKYISAPPNECADETTVVPGTRKRRQARESSNKEGESSDNAHEKAKLSATVEAPAPEKKITLKLDISSKAKACGLRGNALDMALGSKPASRSSSATPNPFLVLNTPDLTPAPEFDLKRANS